MDASAAHKQAQQKRHASLCRVAALSSGAQQPAARSGACAASTSIQVSSRAVAASRSQSGRGVGDLMFRVRKSISTRVQRENNLKSRRGGPSRPYSAALLDVYGEFPGAAVAFDL